MNLFMRLGFGAAALAASLGAGLVFHTAGADAATGCGKDVKCVIDFGNARIDERVTKLQELIDRVNKHQHLTDDQKTAIVNDANTNITNLQTLRTKLDAETVVDAARADVKSIYVDYRIFAVVLPRDNREIVLDHLTNAQAKFVALEPKINAAIQAAAAKGENVTQEQQQYNDLVAKVNDAATQNTAANGLIGSLTPANYPGTKATLEQMSTDLKASGADLKTALEDLKDIIKELKLDPNSGTTVSTPTATP